VEPDANFASVGQSSQYPRHFPYRIVSPSDTAPSVDSYESHLIACAKARSPEAWTEIFERDHDRVFRYVRARVCDDATAEDLTSSVFVGALKGIDSYHSRGRPLLAWLYGIARNVVASHQREALRRERPRLMTYLAPQFVRGDRPTAGAVNWNEVSAISALNEPEALIDSLNLRHAIARLPESQRDVIILRFFVGLDATEISALVGKGPPAVYSLQARAIVALRKYLG
jgi:RNA polymerase sigma-70 factor (ECF subfamily)